MGTVVVLAVAWFVMSLLLSNATTALNTTLLIMLYLLVPWMAVNLTDYFFVRRGHYAIANLFTPTGIYGAWSWRGLTAFLVGIAAEIPFVVLPFYVGPVAAAMGEVDIAFIVGLVVSGVGYVLLTRSLDVSHELKLIESHPEIGGPGQLTAISTQPAAPTSRPLGAPTRMAHSRNSPSRPSAVHHAGRRPNRPNRRPSGAYRASTSSPVSWESVGRRWPTRRRRPARSNPAHPRLPLGSRSFSFSR